MSDASRLEAPGAGAGPQARPHPRNRLEVPLGLLAEITHRCPLQCPYCSNPVALERPADELSVGDWARVFEEAAALGVVQVHISGGEPLARGDAVEIVRGARSAGLYVNLITAAVTLTPQRADGLAEAGVDHVQVSFQDATPEGCGRITNAPRAFEKKLAASRLVSERGLPLTINAVMHRHNLDRVADMIELALELHAHRLEIAHVQYYGWAYRNRAALMPQPDQVEHANRVVEDARERLRGRLLIDYVLPDYYAERPKPCMGGWGRQFITVMPSGWALPCQAAINIPGLVFDNVQERHLDWIWRHSDAFNRFRGTAWMRAPCRTCPERAEDFGGCRCQAFLLTGDASNADPVCDLSPFHSKVLNLLTDLAGNASESFAYRRY